MPLDSETIPELEHMTLKILEEYDAEQGTWVARCLETGAVATAPDQQTLQKLINETIQLEVLLAIKKNDFANLFHKPASGEVCARWYRTAGMSSGALTTYDLELNFDLTPRREVKSEKIGISKASIPRTA
jgi:hypothetical protein